MAESYSVLHIKQQRRNSHLSSAWGQQKSKSPTWFKPDTSSIPIGRSNYMSYGESVIKVKQSTWHERGTNRKIWVFDENRTYDLPSTGRALYPLSYENSWRVRLFNWVHVWVFVVQSIKSSRGVREVMGPIPVADSIFFLCPTLARVMLII